MSQIVRFDKNNGIRIILFDCFDFEEDGSFKTRTKLFKTDTNHYSADAKLTNYKTWVITPKVSYEVFETTTDIADAKLLSISYYAGNDTKDIIECLGNETFIIDDKIPVEYRIPTEKYPNGGEETAKGRVNNILNYIGLDHIDKPLNRVTYKGDCYSKIKLLPECVYKLYKFLYIYHIMTK